MEAMKGARVGVGEEQDMGDGMQCSDHPYRNNPGGICAFCLQDKLGKLVSSSFPLPIRAPSSSSSSPSFRSHLPPPSSSTPLPPSSSAPPPSSSRPNPTPVSHYNHYSARRTRLPFLLPKKKKKKPTSAPTSDNIPLKRSKSTATPRRNRSLVDLDHDHDDLVIGPFSPRKRNGFWSFLYLSSKSSKKLDSKSFRDNNSNNTPRISAINLAAASTSSAKLKEKCCSGSSLKTDTVVEQDHNNSNSNSPNTVSASSFERKVSRSKSVGCGSRSFSGDFFERISTGFGDCTLRRVESQREGKPKGTGGGASAAVSRAGEHHHHHCMKERVRCGGLFSGFMMTSSSSSSSSSSYWVSSSADAAAAAAAATVNGKSATVALSHNRGRSWGWAFASPMRAFSGKPSSKESNRRDIIRDANDKNATPSLSAIPSLLAVRG